MKAMEALSPCQPASDVTGDSAKGWSYDNWVKIEKYIQDNFAEEGIELALPLIPWESDDEGDGPAKQPAADAKLSKAQLLERYKGDLAMLSTVPAHNHTTREVHKNEEFKEKLRSGSQLCPTSRGVPVLHVKDTPRSAFIASHVMKNGFPALIKGIQEADEWGAREKWRPIENLLEHYGQVPLKVGEVPPIHGMGRAYQIRLPLVLFKEYADSAIGDSPFYGFEYDFNDERAALLADYKVPEYFQIDFFDVDPIARNFYTNNRHLIVGGERTGTNLHFDPKGTSAWNSLLIGRKKWAMFPPGTDMEYIQKIKTRTCSSGTAPGGPASYWWLDIAPTLPADVGMVEFIQNPGDTVFIPPGWWHAVINTEFSMAITQNVLIPESLPFVWAQLRKDWPRFVQYLESNYPEKLQELGVQDITPPEKRILSLEDEEFLVEFHSTQNQ